MDFKPQNYNILFSPDLQNLTFTGHEIFTFSVEKDIDKIELDAVGLTIEKGTLKDNADNLITINKDETQGKVTFIFKTSLKKGIYSLTIDFSGKFSQGLAGWYTSKYEVNRQTKYIVTTHFEPADARTVFPCVDHPLYKATFDISLLVEKNLTAVSNMPTCSEETKGTKKLISFDRTPIMSTYLLYLGVGEFSFYEDSYKKIIIRGITTVGKEKHTKLAVEWTKKCLSYFEEYFQMPYALPKVDLLAIPDFAAGAMENWGAITFRENLLLYYTNASSIATKQAITEVVAHELAHQWFGNLVTMKWWNDLWLNESFATFMAYKVVDHFYPEWHIWSDYITSMVFKGMDLDSLHSSHPIQVTINHVEQINELFDEIAYDKGGGILRMLEEYVGMHSFRDGLRNYIKTFAYKNTEGKDLWECLEKTSQKRVDTIMESFIVQSGFPLVKATKKDIKLHISQEQFLYTSENKEKKWVIPLVIDTGKKDINALIENATGTIPLPDSPLFLNCNKEYAGFYITEYDQILLTTFGKNLSKSNYTDRLGLIHDQYCLTLANRKTLKEFTQFIQTYFLSEKDPSVINYCISKLAQISLMVQNDEEKSLVITLAKNALNSTGFSPRLQENPHINYLRNSALYALSLFDDKEVTQFALESFKKGLVDKTSIHPDIKGTIYALAVWSDDSHYETVQTHYRDTLMQEEKAKYLSALGNSKNKQQLSDTLEFCLTPEVRFAHILYVIAGISRNPHGRELVVDWLITNWEKLIQSGSGMHMIIRHMLKMIVPICGINKEDEIRAFLTKQHIPTLDKTFAQIQEELTINSNFVRQNCKKSKNNWS